MMNKRLRNLVSESNLDIKVLKEHFGLELPEKFQTPVDASDTSSERVHKTGKRKHG